MEWVTREVLAQGKRVYSIDVDFTNAFNAMSQAALGRSCARTAFLMWTCSCHCMSIQQ